MNLLRSPTVLLFTILLASLLGGAAPAQEPTVSFVRDVAPILVKHCSACHGATKSEAGYSVATFDRLMQAGESEYPPIVPGEPGDSELLALVTDDDDATRMPKDTGALSPSEQQLLRRWIAEGATFDGRDRALSLGSQLPARMHPAAPEIYPAATPVLALAFDRSGSHVFTSGYHEVLEWDLLATDRPSRRFAGLPQRVHAIALDPLAARLAIGGGTPGEYGEVQLIALDDEARRPAILVTTDVVLCVAWSPDGQTLAAGGADNNLHLLDARTGEERWSSPLHSDWITSITFAHDGRFVVSGSRDHSVKVFDAATGDLFTNYTRHTQTLPDQPMWQHDVFAVAGLGTMVVSTGEGGRVHLWDPVRYRNEDGTAAQMETRFQVADHVRIRETDGADIFAVMLLDDRVICASRQGSVLELKRADLEIARSWRASEDWLFALAVHGDRIATGGMDGSVHVIDRTSDAIVTFAGQPRAGG